MRRLVNRQTDTDTKSFIIAEKKKIMIFFSSRDVDEDWTALIVEKNRFLDFFDHCDRNDDGKISLEEWNKVGNNNPAQVSLWI